MNGWHESIKDQTPDHPDHAKKPGLVKREQELKNVELDQSRDVGMALDDPNPPPILGIPYLDKAASVNQAKKRFQPAVDQAKKNLKRQQEVNK